jgi:hypothetical protein
METKTEEPDMKTEPSTELKQEELKQEPVTEIKVAWKNT